MALSELDDRLKLSIARTSLAFERTYAAWIRTGLAALASGIGLHSLLKGQESVWVIRLFSSGLILFSIFCFFAAMSCERRIGRLFADRLPGGLLAFQGAGAVLVGISVVAVVTLWL